MPSPKRRSKKRSYRGGTTSKKGSMRSYRGGATSKKGIKRSYRGPVYEFPDGSEIKVDDGEEHPVELSIVKRWVLKKPIPIDMVSSLPFLREFVFFHSETKSELTISQLGEKVKQNFTGLVSCNVGGWVLPIFFQHVPASNEYRIYSGGHVSTFAINEQHGRQGFVLVFKSVASVEGGIGQEMYKIYQFQRKPDGTNEVLFAGVEEPIYGDAGVSGLAFLICFLLMVMCLPVCCKRSEV